MTDPMPDFQNWTLLNAETQARLKARILSRTEQWRAYDKAIAVADDAWRAWEAAQKKADGLELEARVHDGNVIRENYERAVAAAITAPLKGVIADYGSPEADAIAEEEASEDARNSGQFGHGA